MCIRDRLIVQDYIRRLKSEVNTPYRIIECDLYEVFLSLLEDKRILKSVAGLEEKRGKKYLLEDVYKRQVLSYAFYCYELYTFS